MSETISIVVPIYNLEKYIEKCIVSVLNQTYKNFELILVNDQSTDSSLKICNKYSKVDSRIKVLTKKNGGVSSARNYGISKSTGEFITFIDGDDYVDSNYLLTLLEMQKLKDFDLVISNAIDVLNGECIHYNRLSNNLILDKNETLKELFIGKKFTSVCWGNLYKRSILKGISFDETLKIAEDFDFIVKYIENINSAIVIKQELYYYLIRSGSSVNSGFNKAWLLELDLKEKNIQKFKGSNLYKYAIYCYVVRNINCAYRMKIDKKQRKIIKNNIKKYYKQLKGFKLLSFKEKMKYLILLLKCIT